VEAYPVVCPAKAEPTKYALPLRILIRHDPCRRRTLRGVRRLPKALQHGPDPTRSLTTRHTHTHRPPPPTPRSKLQIREITILERIVRLVLEVGLVIGHGDGGEVESSLLDRRGFGEGGRGPFEEPL
jgi:hypothetical protein